MIIYDPSIKERTIFNCDVVSDIDKFARKSSIIITNRTTSILNKYKNKVFTKDIYGRD